MANNGCEYGRATRDKVKWFVDEFSKWKNNDFHHFQLHVLKKLDELQKDDRNKPTWIVSIILTFFCSLTVALVTFILTWMHLFSR